MLDGEVPLSGYWPIAMRNLDDSAASTFAQGGRDSGAPPILSAGDLISGRYRIVRFLARGGMGEVYEAEDLELGERVALKTIRPLQIGRERAMDRFRRETALARKVTHPNVCRIFDIGTHRGAQPPHESLLFLTMELLRGESLAQRLRRVGRFEEADALPLVRQMGEGLEAAHRAGVIHRDFKSANVVLVSQKAGGAERPPLRSVDADQADTDTWQSPALTVEALRAVITDFGLACSDCGIEDASMGSGNGAGLIGTPDYMAPEQVESGEVTAATDIYAFGIVLYEMLTGTLPFSGETPLAAALQRLDRPAPSPRSRVPGLDPHWERVILRCLEREPAERYARATDVALDLEGQSVAAGRVCEKRRSVAMLGFKNLSGRPENSWLSTALAEMLGTELAAGEKLRIVPGEAVARMRLELGLAEEEAYGDQTLSRIHGHLGADLVVLGSYVVLGGAGGAQIRLDLRLQDAAAGVTLALEREMDAETHLFDLVSRAGQRLRGRLGLGGLSRAEAERARAAFPSSPESARLYSEGLAKLRAYELTEARELLEKAVAADPLYPLAHLALAQAMSALGFVEKARDHARLALDLSGSLSREERLLVQGHYHEAAGEIEQAAEMYAALFTFFPDDLDYGLHLARTQTLAGRQDALCTIEALRKLPAPSSEDPRIDLEEARAAGAFALLERMRDAAVRAVRKGRVLGARLLVAPARYREGVALRNLGHPREAQEAIEEAQKIFEEAGDQMGSAVALHYLARLMMTQGRLAQARSLLEQAVGTYRALGNQKSTAYGLSYLGYALLCQGEIADAQELFEESLAMFRDLGDPGGLASALLDSSEVLYFRGRLPEAKARLLEGLELYRKRGKRHGEAGALFMLGNLLLASGSAAEARRYYEEALKGWSRLGLKRYAALDRLTQARLALEEKRPAEAEAFAREAAQAAQALVSVNEESAAQVLLAQALLAQGRRSAALEAARAAMKTAEASEKCQVRLAAALEEARIRGDLEQMDEARSEAERRGFVELGLEARLALGLAEVCQGDSKGGNRRLEALETEAAARGYGRIARQAAASRAPQADLGEILML